MSRIFNISGQGDPRTSNFFTFYCKVWILSLVYVALSSLYFIWLPKFQKTRGVYRPMEAFIVIYNGFMFGCYGTGLAISYYATNQYSTFWDCSPIDVNATDPKATLTVLMAVALNYLKMIRFLEPLMYKVAGKRPPFSGIIAAEGAIVHLLAILPLKYQCGNFFTYPTFLDGLSMITYYAHQTLKCGGFIPVHYQTWHHWNIAIQIFTRYYVYKQALWGLDSPVCQGDGVIKSLINLQYWGTMISFSFYFFDLFINGQQSWKDDEDEDEDEIGPKVDGKHLKSS